MNLSSGRGLGQPWLRGAAALAAMVCLALLAACGGSRRPLPRAREDPRACRGQLAYARCMRSHGVPDFAEPDSNGNCNHLLNTDTQLSAARTQRTLGQLVKYSRCMRAHGVPGFPDPTTISGGDRRARRIHL